jgi:hypothetical protein
MIDIKILAILPADQLVFNASETIPMSSLCKGYACGVPCCVLVLNLLGKYTMSLESLVQGNNNVLRMR